MTPDALTIRRLRRLLRDLLRHEHAVEQSSVCVSRGDALEGKRAREWEALRVRIEAEARDVGAEAEAN